MVPKFLSESKLIWWRQQKMRKKTHNLNVSKQKHFISFNTYTSNGCHFFSRFNEKNQLIFLNFYHNLEKIKSKIYFSSSNRNWLCFYETSIVICHDRNFQFQYNDSSHPYWMNEWMNSSGIHTNTCTQTLPLESVLLVISVQAQSCTGIENIQNAFAIRNARICILFMNKRRKAKRWQANAIKKKKK